MIGNKFLVLDKNTWNHSPVDYSCIIHQLNLIRRIRNPYFPRGHLFDREWRLEMLEDGILGTDQFLIRQPGELMWKATLHFGPY